MKGLTLLQRTGVPQLIVIDFLSLNKDDYALLEESKSLG